MRPGAFILLLPAAALLAACATSPSSHFYTLSAEAPAASAPAAASYTVAIGAATVPEAVDRPQFVVRNGANGVSIDEFERWASPLRGEVSRILALDLAKSLGGAIVYAYPHVPSVPPEYTVGVDVQRFDATLGEGVVVEALWTVRPAKGEAKNGRSLVHEAAQGKDYAALVAAYSRAVARLSADIAGAIRAMPSTGG
jgi:uncharacterized lipoprotein YmbA